MLQVALILVSHEPDLDLVRLLGVDNSVGVAARSVDVSTFAISARNSLPDIFTGTCSETKEIRFHNVNALAFRVNSLLLDIPAAFLVVELGQVDSSD